MTSFQLLKGLTGIESELLVSVEQQAIASKVTQNKAQVYFLFSMIYKTLKTKLEYCTIQSEVKYNACFFTLAGKSSKERPG